MKKERLLHINKSAKALLLSVITVTLIYGCSLSSVAVLNQGAPSTAYSINPCVVYGLAAAISLAVTAAYSIFNKKKEPRLVFLFFAVLVVNTGYFLISVSKTLDAALWANRVSYLGSVFLPFCMLISIAQVCKIRTGKVFICVSVAISCLVFLLAATPGWLDIYYKQVSLITENGFSRLDKVYGELHCLYLVYLVAYFSLMVGFILYAVIRKKLSSYKYAALLSCVVLLNLLIWFIEQIIHIDFELLSVSYIVSELLLMFIYSMLNDHNELKVNLEKATAEAEKKKENHNTSKAAYSSEQIKEALSGLQLTEKLTSREEEVIILILSGYKRKDVAQQLYVSENTVKTHLSHIFSKIGVSSKKELLDLMFSQKE